MGELVRAGAMVGLSATVALVLRSITLFVVVVWSLRADEAGREHALAVLRVLAANRTVKRRSGR